MKKEKTFRVNYYYDGKGSAIIKAKNKKEAEDKYYEGDWIDDQDNSENYELDTIEEE